MRGENTCRLKILADSPEFWLVMRATHFSPLSWFRYSKSIPCSFSSLDSTNTTSPYHKKDLTFSSLTYTAQDYAWSKVIGQRSDNFTYPLQWKYFTAWYYVKKLSKHNYIIFNKLIGWKTIKDSNSKSHSVSQTAYAGADGNIYAMKGLNNIDLPWERTVADQDGWFVHWY